MSENTGTKRLSKVAKDIGVGLNTLIEHLTKKGFTVESNPNTKITDEMYELLHKDFSSEIKVKEDAQQLGRERTKPKDIVIEIAKPKPIVHEEEEEEGILIKTELTNIVDPIFESEPYVDQIETPPIPVKEKAIVEEAIVEIPEPKKPKIEPVEEGEEGGLRVIGKIDLSSINQKTKPDKKSKAKKEQEAAEKKEVEKTAKKKKREEVVEAEIVKAEPVEEIKTPEVIIEETVLPKEQIAPPEEIKTREPNYEKLSGLKVMGKIILPVDPPKKTPVASSDNLLQKKKRKRKNTPGGPDQQPAKPGFVKPDPSKPVDRRSRFSKPYEKKPDVPKEISDKEIQDKLKATLARMNPGSKNPNLGAVRSKVRKQKRNIAAAGREEALAADELENKRLKVTEFVTANELAKMMDLGITQIISACMSLGMMVSINQRLDAETIAIVAEEFGFEVEFVSAETIETLEEEIDDPKDLIPRTPIVTVMGHVDHGKTSLLDYIRSANVIAGEAGGITQHIGAYEVKLANGKKVTFLDTPGHEAFTAMRARGAKITDIVIIVVAADDSVMPQTKEAISHSLAAGVPIIFAINKIDREGANPERIKEQLSAINILVEDWGGKYQCQEISAKKGINIDQLLEKVLLEADMLELKANPDRRASGTVIEATLDKGRGIVTTMMVQTGTLRVGDPILAGIHHGKVKALFDERGKKLTFAGPSTPAVVLGFDKAPQAGDLFLVTKTEQESKEIANKRSQLQREQGIRTHKHITLDEIGRRLAIGNFKELNIIVKGDVDGSVEALSDSLIKLSTEEVQVNVIYKAVGQISESDIMLASASDAIIIGFQVRPSPQARKLAETEAIDIRLYSIIYSAIEEIKAAIVGMLAPKIEEKILGNAEVREVFKVSKVGSIAGCMVTDGKIPRNAKVRLIRDGVVVYTGELSSLKRFKDDAKEVLTGYDCGMTIANYNDLKVGDYIEAYDNVEVKRTLK